MSTKCLLLLFLGVVLLTNPSIAVNEAESKAEKGHESPETPAAAAPPPLAPKVSLNPIEYIYWHPWWYQDCHHKHKPTKAPTATPKMAPN